ncbi:MAG: DpnD/PcfM family protein [Peptococcaceae bacterium]|nr:DpnD/PcfM family protein [Peptococcaceae bacterium]
MVKEFEVEVEETLSRKIIIKAEDDTQALRIIRKMYYGGGIVLSADDCMGVAFIVDDAT